MKIELKKDSNRKVVAVLGSSNQGIWLESSEGGYRFLGPDNRLISTHNERQKTVEDLLKGKDRTPVYEGDTITITF